MTAPVRVCFPFMGQDLGGSHISALKLVRGFDRGRVSPVVVVHETRGALADYLRREAIPFLHLPLSAALSPGASAGRSARDYVTRALPFMRRFLRAGRFDCVHTNDGWTHLNWGPAARLAGSRLVWHHRGDPAARGVNWLAPLIADRLVTVSRFAAPARPLLPMEHRLRVIHSPFEHPADIPDRAAAKAALLRELALPAETRVLGYFGLLIERKRPVLFVEAVAALIARHPGLPVVGCLFGAPALGGEAVEAAVRRRAEELGIADRIRLMGFRQPVEPLMAATDVLLVPAFGEPFGRTLIEAMLLGTPVVATRHGGNPEAIENGRTGFLVEPESAEAFVAPVAALLSDEALFSRIAAEAGAEARRSHDVAGHVERITALYAEILRTSPVAVPRPSPAFPERSEI